MHLTVTIARDEQLAELRALIDELRKRLTESQLTVFEAPPGLDYPFSFPVVTVSDLHSKSRQFGVSAIEYLEGVASGREEMSSRR